MNRIKTIDYIEFRANDLPAVKKFYTQVFGWEFEDYGPEYTSFKDGRSAGGFALGAVAPGAGPLVVIYVDDLPSTEKQVKEAGGKSPRTSLLFPEDRASTSPIPTEMNWPHGLRVDVGYTPTGKGLGEDSSALALPMRKRSNLPSSRDIRPVYQ